MDSIDTETASYELLQSIVSAVSSSSYKYILSTFKRLVESPEIKPNIGKGIINYVLAAGLLSFAGREIDKKSLTNVVESLGVAPDSKMADSLLTTGIKSHLVYLYAYYFLLAGRIPVSEQKMMDVVMALGLKPDKDRAKRMFELCTQGGEGI